MHWCAATCARIARHRNWRAQGAATSSGARQPCSHAVLVRVHTRCTAGDVFAADCRCRETLDQSMRMIAEEGCGVLLYLHNTSRGFEIDHEPVTTAAFAPGGARRCLRC